MIGFYCKIFALPRNVCLIFNFKGTNLFFTYLGHFFSNIIFPGLVCKMEAPLGSPVKKRVARKDVIEFYFQKQYFRFKIFQRIKVFASTNWVTYNINIKNIKS